MSTSTKPYAVNVTFTIQNTRRNEFINLILNDQKQSLSTEQGIIRFVVGEDATTPNKFYLHEEYVNQEAFARHTATPHFKAWQKFVESDPWVQGGAPELGFYNCMHEVGKKEPIRSGYALNASFTIQPSRRDEFLQIIKHDQEKTLMEEKGSIQFVVGEDKEVTNKFYLFEQYVDEVAYKEHGEMEHFKRWVEFVGTKPFVEGEGGEPVVGLYNTLKIE